MPVLRSRRLPFQHTAARRRLLLYFLCDFLSLRGFNTQPPEGGWSLVQVRLPQTRFQHTAARRRLSRILWLSSPV